jgi:CubicO group peptidase (beta-lactamase class C family)
MNLQSTYPYHDWERTDPAAAGWSAEALAKARDYSVTVGSTAVMIVQHGRVVAEWGHTTRKSDVASIRKSFLSALIGIAIAEGRLRLTDTLAELGIDDKEPSLSEREKQATLADLMTSRSGVYHLVDKEPPAAVAQRPPRGSHAPGEFWYYNNWDFNALGTIYEKVSGEGIHVAFKRRISDAIGIQDFTVADGHYGDAHLSLHRNFAFRMSPRDLARFGLLYLGGGRWNNEQVVPAGWIRDSTSTRAHPHNEIFPGRGYGFMWWSGFASDRAPLVTLPKGTFYALGFGAQYLFVIPEHDLVVVHTVDMERKDWPRISDFQIGRLMWLILSAAGIENIGPDTSAATASLMSGDLIGNSLAGRTLRYATTAPDGPYLMRLEANGTASLRKGPAGQAVLTGKWWVDGDRLCRGWDKFQPRFDCWPVATDGATISLYGDHDTMFLQGILVSE